jgi:hypothetical protein
VDGASSAGGDGVDRRASGFFGLAIGRRNSYPASCLGLCAKAWIAAKQDYRGTETWLILARDHKPPAEIAKRTLPTLLRETYFRFARFSAGISATLWLAAVVLPARRTLTSRLTDRHDKQSPGEPV